LYRKKVNCYYKSIEEQTIDLGPEKKEPCYNGFYANHTICDINSNDSNKNNESGEEIKDNVDNTIRNF
jgi:hypothetical protein